jgi:cobalt/nickel transport system permease protein
MPVRNYWIVGFFFLILLLPRAASAMHIMEGFLPPGWSIAWAIITIPFILVGYLSIKKIIHEHPRTMMLLAMACAFAFVLSALKLPSVTGSCSHPTGLGFGTILFGPMAMTVIAFIVLLFQALLLAHGGLTTIGANTFSMGVIGPLVAFSAYWLVKKIKGPQWLAVFLAAALGNLATYITTAVQLALAFPSEIGGFTASLAKFASIFALTQVPLAVSEGILTILIFNAVAAYGVSELKDLKVILKEG